MNQGGVDRLKEDIDSRIEYFRQEYDLNYAEVIGVLEMAKLDMFMECLEDGDNDE